MTLTIPELAERAAAAIDRSSMTRTAVAALCGVQQSKVSRALNHPSAKDLGLILRILDRVGGERWEESTVRVWSRAS